MALKLTRNSFELGRNSDTDPSKIGLQQYMESHNLQLVGEGKFYALQNIKGDFEVKEIVGTNDINILGVFRNRYKVGDDSLDGLTIFTASETLFKIWAYTASDNQLYELYEESIDTDYLTEDRVIDAVGYPESGVDFLYFTDFYNEIRFIKCEIPSPYTANFLSSFEISLLRKGANGIITLDSVNDNDGTLLSGTYQFAYRMLNPLSKKFTKWSALTGPIFVYNDDNTTIISRSGIGLLTDHSVTISILPSEIEYDQFEYVQLAVIENVSSGTPTTASLLEIQPFPGTSLTVDYKSNSRVGLIPVEDITVDLAQIETVKTLNVKENRLFAGNIKYTELEYDNGNPEITSGSVISESTAGGDSFASGDFSSRYLGYFRDEVYRFGIVYSDENGNKSEAKALDLSSISGNQITSPLTDIKFPDRSVSNSYTVLTPSNNTRSLGLRLLGLVNHPTWARSFEIVRVKRKKDILFQTPIIPMTKVYGVGAASDYPTTYYNGIGDTTIAEAQPQTASYTLVPKNLMWPELREIAKNEIPYNYSMLPFVGFTPQSDNYRSAQEVYLKRTSSYSFASIFPGPSMYDDTPFNYTGAEKIDIIDYALLKVDYNKYSTATYTEGDYVNTSIVGNFYALDESQYYFDAGYIGKSISSSLKGFTITDYEFFSNFGQTDATAGSSTMDYQALQTQGIGFWQTPPAIQKMGVIQMGSSLSEGSLVFSAGTLNAVGNNNFIVGASGTRYEQTNTLTNRYVTGYTSFSPSGYVSAVPIANVKLGLGDDRYGDINAQHEYISTGARYCFSSAEVDILEAGGSVAIDIDVWGGDCFVASHLFKICDSTYSITNQNKNQTPPAPDGYGVSVEKWESVYNYDISARDPVMCIPVAVKNSGQYVQVVLESEYNGDVRDIDVVSYDNTENGFPIYINTSEASIRTPLTYKYNLNLSRPNDQKVFQSELLYSFKQNEFKARVIYSDLKIYNSDQAGFDIFRVANIYDLEENRYGITKLSVARDALYAIQEKGVVYLPTGERQIESTDAGQLAVRSGDVIGRALVIDSERGSQHLRGIIESGGIVYIPDNINKNVYALTGQELQPITKDNETSFREMFGNKIPEKDVVGVYDPVRREYWLASPDVCHVFNEALGVWVSNYEFEGNLDGGVSSGQKLYVIGKTEDSLVVSQMYEGAVNQLFGREVTPRVKFSINPDEETAKTFDDIVISSSERLATIDFEVERESFLGNQTASESLDDLSIEGTFRLKTPRAADNARLRGQRCLTTVNWKDVQSALRLVYTKYRLSPKPI